MSLTGAGSPEEIKNMIHEIVAQMYSPTNVTGSYSMHQITNGLGRWVFVQVFNAPRGLNMFNLYCYEWEWERQDPWVLRAYVPVNAHYYTNSFDRELHFQNDGDYVKVIFRDRVVFTGISKMGLTFDASRKRRE